MELYQFLFKTKTRQKDLAEGTGISAANINAIMNKKHSPSLKNAVKIVEFSKGTVTYKELLSETDIKEFR